MLEGTIFLLENLYYAVSVFFLVLSAFVILFNDKTRSWIYRNLISTIIEKISAIFNWFSKIYRWIVRTFFVWYKLYTNHSEYRISSRSLDAIVPAIVWFAHERRLSIGALSRIRKDPIRALKSMGVKTVKEGSNFRVKSISRKLSYSKYSVDTMDLLRRINFLLKENGAANEIEFIPAMYVMGFPCKKYSHPGKFPIGVIHYAEYIRGGKHGVDYHERKKHIDAGVSLLPHINEEDLLKEVRVILMVEEAKKSLRIRALRKMEFNVSNLGLSTQTQEFSVEFKSEYKSRDEKVYLQKKDISKDITESYTNQEDLLIKKFEAALLKSLPENLGIKHDPERKIYPFSKEPYRSQKKITDNLFFKSNVVITMNDGSIVSGRVKDKDLETIDKDNEFIDVHRKKKSSKKDTVVRVKQNNIVSIEIDKK